MAKLSIILQTCAYLLSTLVWMAQILPIQHRSERDMVQNYTQLKPISQVERRCLGIPEALEWEAGGCWQT